MLNISTFFYARKEYIRKKYSQERYTQEKYTRNKYTRKKLRRALGTLAAVSLALCAELLHAGQPAQACAPQAIDETVRVNYVYDGDTLQLEDGRKLRLIGIDTPEIHSRRRTVEKTIKQQGEKARRALVKLLNSADNRLGLHYGAQRFDRYRRTLAHAYLADGRNLQAWLLRQGYAMAYTTPPNERMSHCYRQQEKLAREQRLGIWRNPHYQLKSTSELNRNSHGLHHIQGRVTRVQTRHNRISVILDHQLEIKIYKEDQAHFSAYYFQQIKGKKLQVRGWLKAYKKPSKGLRHGLKVRHPDAFQVLF